MNRRIARKILQRVAARDARGYRVVTLRNAARRLYGGGPDTPGRWRRAPLYLRLCPGPGLVRRLERSEKAVGEQLCRWPTSADKASILAYRWHRREVARWRVPSAQP